MAGLGIHVDWEDSPFKSLDQAKALLAPRAVIYHKWVSPTLWMDFIIVRDEDDREVRHVIAQASGPDGRHGPVRQGELDVPLLAPDHRCLRTGERYTGSWHHNPDIHGEASPRSCTLIAHGTYKACLGESGFIHEYLYDDEGHMFWRILCPEVTK